MFLTSVDEIRQQLGFDDMVDITAAIEMALNSAEAQIAALIGTRFDRAEVVDTFWVREPAFMSGAHVETKFRLSRGMLVGSPQVIVAQTAAQLDSGTTLAGFIADLEKGLITDYRTRFNNQYVQVRYTSGFEVDPDNPQSYDLTQVPLWLQEAAKLKCLMHLADQAVVTEAGIKLDTRVLDAQFAALISQHLRYAPTAYLPL